MMKHGVLFPVLGFFASEFPEKIFMISKNVVRRAQSSVNRLNCHYVSPSVKFLKRQFHEKIKIKWVISSPI
jgi:hypothetical protein